MGNRFCHRIKANHGTEAPSQWIFFDVETYPAAVGLEGRCLRHTFRLGCASYVRVEKGKITRRDTLQFRDPAVFWAWVLGHLSAHRPTYVVAHNLTFDFRLVDGFRLLESENPEKWRLCLRSPPVIMRGELAGKRVTFVDSLNYFRVPLEEMGRAFGLPKGVMPPFTASDSDWYTYCIRDVEVLEKAMLALESYWRQADLGVFGRTAAQCSWAAFRHRFCESEIFVHDNDTVLHLERAAYYGGRLEAYQLGRTAGPVYQLDANGLYPYVMKEYTYPVKLIRHEIAPPVQWLSDRIHDYGVIASVLLDTKETFPKRPVGGKTYYPTGVYRTVLCGPELATALVTGSVIRVESAALYELAPLFGGFVDFFHGERLRWREEGNPAFERLAKLLLNGLSGKFAQRAPRHVEAPDQIAPKPWCKWSENDKLNDCRRRFRAVGRVAQEEVEDGETHQSSPVISAYITSHGRRIMEMFKHDARRENVLYMDTDSLIVNQEGFDRLLLAGHVHRDRLGALKLECEANAVHINGLKDYYLGGKVVRGAVKRGARQLGKGVWEQWEWDGMPAALSSRGSAECNVWRRTVILNRAYTKGTVGPDGRTAPIQLFEHPDLEGPEQHGYKTPQG
jgi:predicted regulator of Ras-like GTPase activity (Roadblock/LC7/MglB family)